MKRLNEKVIMMVRGLMIGSSMAAVLTVLVLSLIHISEPTRP